MISQVRSRIPRRPQLVDELADPLVEIGHAIVVGVDGEGHFLGRDRRLVDPPPVLDQAAAVVVDRLGPEPMEPPRGQFIGIVGVVEVQEGEEWPPRLRPSRDPVQELAIDHRRPLAVDDRRLPEPSNVRSQPRGLDPSPRGIGEELQPLQGSIDEHGRLQRGELGEDEIR